MKCLSNLNILFIFEKKNTYYHSYAHANISSFSRQCVLGFPGHDIVASFMLEKPVSFVNDNILQLADDIFDEISVSHTKVCPIILVSLIFVILP